MSNSAIVMGLDGAVIVAGVLMTYLWRLSLARRVWLAGSTREFSKISAYQLALMNDGVARVALTAVVRLIGRKALIPEVAGVLVKSGKYQGTLDPFENEAVALAPAVLQGLLTELAQQLKRKGMITALRHELVGMGYMRALASRRWWSAYGQNLLPFALLITAALGAQIKLATDLELDLDSLLDFTILACVVMLIVAWPTRLTAFGRYIIWSAKQHHPDYKTARAREGEALDTKKLGQATALYGQDALAGSDMAWIPAVLKHAELSSHSD
jgi:uncharacterized protein (TIGR04222 family)